MAKSPNTEADLEAAPATEEAKASKSKKAPLPEGWVTPVQFAKALSARDGVEIRPQIIYGYVKNSKEFPHDKNVDGAVIVHLERSFQFVDGLRARKAERQAEKAAKEAEKATEPAV